MLDLPLLEAYHQTNYKFDDTLLNIDKTSSKAASLLQPFSPAGGLFITAWNPLGKERTVEENEQANQELKNELLKQGLNVTEGYGESPDGKWRENSFFAYPIDQNSSLKLCCTFEQNAVVYVTCAGLPILLLNPNLK
ncbi:MULTISPECIES: DUF3293 domain-containing protein [unclassified Psychrobacter]|uniref:DUF3293 domain-containing protein n=1 Tax=unclassified Psychrobacter TaxID=196806 RepID=UPI003F4478DC